MSHCSPLIHRRDTLRAKKIMQDQLLKHPKITVLWHHEVTEVLGDDSPRGVTAVRAFNVNTCHIPEGSMAAS